MPPNQKIFNVERLGLIYPKSGIDQFSRNINGPCIFKVPYWHRSKLGNYYILFSSHSGHEIQLLYSNFIHGDWIKSNKPIIDLSNFNDAYDHIASPDIYIDNKNRQYILYFHARSRSKGREQWTFAAVTDDLISYSRLIDEPIAPFYLKIFKYNQMFYGMCKGGNLWRSKDGLSKFEPGINPFDRKLDNELWHNDKGSIRHVGLNLVNNKLNIYFSVIGDCPERIIFTSINLEGKDWREWSIGEMYEVIKPEYEYEGSELPLIESNSGPSDIPQRQLRDPHLINENGELYLIYTVCGEFGLALCKLNPH